MIKCGHLVDVHCWLLPNLFLQEYNFLLRSAWMQVPGLKALPTLFMFMFWPGPAMMATIELSFRLLLLEKRKFGH